MGGMSADQRAHPRAEVRLRVVYQRLNAFIADYTHNLSKGGTFIKTGTPLPLHSTLDFQLMVPSVDDPLRLLGRVVWVTNPADADDESPAGMGLEFEWSSDADREHFEEAVARVIDNALGPGLRHGLEEQSGL